MADEILDKARDALEGQIDFEGQKLAELLTTVLLAVVGLLAFLVGYSQQDIYQTLYIGLGGTALTFLIVVPPWPFYKKHPVPWLPARSQIGGVNVQVDGKKVS